MKKILLFCICALACFTLLTPPAEAAKSDWADKSYNFRNVKTALVCDINTSKVTLANDIVEKNLQELFQQKADKLRIQHLTYDQASRKISLKLFKDLDELHKSAPEEAEALFHANLSDLAEIYITADLLQYETGGYTVPAHTEWRNREETNTWTDKDGKQHTDTHTITYPEFVPDEYVSTVTVKVRFDAVDAKTGSTIFSREEDRTRTSEDNPHDVYGRIISSFFSDLGDKINK